MYVNLAEHTREVKSLLFYLVSKHLETFRLSIVIKHYGLYSWSKMGERFDPIFCVGIGLHPLLNEECFFFYCLSFGKLFHELSFKCCLGVA